MIKDRDEETSELFKALSHPIRLKIVCGLIKKNECNVSKMVEQLNLPQPLISQHLTILKNAGIIQGYRDGNQICYKVINDEVRQIIKALECQ